ncbi:MAG: AAA family ATPase [Candidatus Improbicoccus devescovinae]|nr:MAG: AAA family ATPase [Candidatus Improbicoccus devescovinae]
MNLKQQKLLSVLCCMGIMLTMGHKINIFNTSPTAKAFFGEKEKKKLRFPELKKCESIINFLNTVPVEPKFTSTHFNAPGAPPVQPAPIASPSQQATTTNRPKYELNKELDLSYFDDKKIPFQYVTTLCEVIIAAVLEESFGNPTLTSNEGLIMQHVEIVLELSNDKNFNEFLDNLELKNFITNLKGEVHRFIRIVRVNKQTQDTAKTIGRISVFSLPLIAAFMFPSVRASVSLGYNSLKQGVKTVKDRFIYNRKKIDEDPVAMLKFFKESLSTQVLGQEKAIRDVCNNLVGWLRQKQIKNNEVGSDLLAFIGSSGTGKTFVCRCLSLSVLGKELQPWQFFSCSTLKPDKKLGSPGEQIFAEDSEIVRQLKLNPNVIIVFDEVDKMVDPTDSLLKMLWQAKDTGIVIVNGKEINVRDTIFVVTSNEQRQCWGLPAKKLSPAEAAGRTIIKRDRNLTNRFCVVEFETISKSVFERIFLTQLQELSTYVSENDNATLILNPDLISNLCDDCVNKNKGVRGAKDLMITLTGQLVEVTQRFLEETGVKPEQFEISYDLAQGNFNIQIIS